MSFGFNQYQDQGCVAFSPRVRTLVQRLWEAGFTPLPLHDEADEDEELGICLECAPEKLVAEAHRLREVVRSWLVPKHEVACPRFDGDTLRVHAMYDPDDPAAQLFLWGVEDKMLGPTSGKTPGR